MTQRHWSFDEVLDECLDRVLVSGEPIESCLSDYPEHADELREALMTAQMLQSVAATVQPRPWPKAVARQRFVDALEKHARHRPWWRLGWARGLSLVPARLAVTVAVAVFLLAGAGTGTVFASQSSVPGDALYPVKRASERTWLALAPQDRRVELQTTFLGRRVEELAAVAQRKRNQFIPGLVQEIQARSERVQELAVVPVMEQLPDPDGGASTVTTVDRRHVSVSPVLAFSAQLERFRERIAALEASIEAEDIRGNLRTVIENLERTQERVGDLLERLDNLLPGREPEDPTGDPLTNVLLPGARPTPVTVPPGMLAGRGNGGADVETPTPDGQVLRGKIDDVNVVVSKEGVRLELDVILDSGEKRTLNVTRNSRVRGRYSLDAAFEALVSETGEIQQMQLQGRTRGRDAESAGNSVSSTGDPVRERPEAGVR